MKMENIVSIFMELRQAESMNLQKNHQKSDLR